jgi:hypothetical protein
MNADHGEFAETETTIRVSWSVEGHDLSGQITYTIMPPES